MPYESEFYTRRPYTSSYTSTRPTISSYTLTVIILNPYLVCVEKLHKNEKFPFKLLKEKKKCENFFLIFWAFKKTLKVPFFHSFSLIHLLKFDDSQWLEITKKNEKIFSTFFFFEFRMNTFFQSSFWVKNKQWWWGKKKMKIKIRNFCAKQVRILHVINYIQQTSRGA